MAISASDLKLLAQYDTPTISNVIELFDIRPRSEGYMDARIRACFPEMPPIVGFASTATMRTAHPRGEGDVYGSLDEQLTAFAELPGPPIVVFQDLDDPAIGATFGEIMCASYMGFGAVGIITNGPGRDLDQVRRLGFAAFTNGVACSHSYSHITSIHQPVRVGGLLVRPGDLLHADVNGVCSIPVAIASAVAEAAGEFVEAESVVIEFAKSGQRDVRAYAEARQETFRRVGELGKKLRARMSAERARA
ncbi:MAG TPA: RraA family protein [Bryobacteraceae bacterium]|nr:RraA family protein [Bryobacteraceae bacterium]